MHQLRVKLASALGDRQLRRFPERGVDRGHVISTGIKQRPQCSLLNANVKKLLRAEVVARELPGLIDGGIHQVPTTL